MNSNIAPEERQQMVQVAVGLLTAKIAQDDTLVQEQLADIIREHGEASGADLGAFAARMAKQVEAATVVSLTLLKTLAPRLGLSDDELNQILGAVAAGRLPMLD